MHRTGTESETGLVTHLEHLKASSFFQDFKDEYLSRIVNICLEESYDAEDLIFAEGQKADKLYVLTEGAVSIQVFFKKHQNIIVSTIDKKGELFGWSALVEPKHYRSGIKCLDKTKVISISAAELEKLFDDDAVMGLTFMRKVAALTGSRLLNITNRLISSIS